MKSETRNFSSALDAIEYFKDSAEFPHVTLTKHDHGKYEIVREKEKPQPKQLVFIIKPKKEGILTEQVQAELIIIAEYFGVALAALTGKNRTRKFVMMRAVAYYYFRNIRKFALADIGFLFNRDHTTIIHGLENHEVDMRFHSYRSDAEKLFEKLSQYQLDNQQGNK